MTNENKIRTEFKIPVDNIEILKAKLEKLNRRAVKIGCPVIAYRELRDEERTLTRTLACGKEIKFVQHYKVVEVTGNSPLVNGWIFVAKVEVTEAGILINAVPGEEIPHRYRDNQRQCEHCNHNRQRTRLYVVRTEAGEYKQVGASCLRDFLGHKNPEAIAQWLEYLRTASDDMEGDFGGGGGRSRVTVRTLDVLAIAHSIVRLYGYVTRKEADTSLQMFHDGLRRDAKDSTSELVNKVLFPPEFTDNFGRTDYVAKAKYDEWCQRVKVDAADENAASEIMNWMIALNPTSDYLNNLHVIAQLDSIETKRIGITVSAVWAWMKDVQKAVKQREAFADKSNQHVGEVKARDEMLLILKDVQIKSSSFQDEVSLVKFEDEAGNAFVWWTGALTLEKDGVHWKGNVYEIGTKFRVRATVKRHGEYKGRLTTNLSRCFLVEACK